MKSIGVITDSHSGITENEAKRLGIKVLPMPFIIDGTCYYENKTITRKEFFEKLKRGAKVTTSQPSPEEVMKIWDEGLLEFEKIIYIPVSSGLSGACMTATVLAQDEPYADRVFVVDNGRVATPLHRSVLDALDMIDKGYDAKYIKDSLEEARANMVIYVGVETLEHLKNGGRIKSTTAFLGNILNIKPILKFDVGMLDSFKNCRGIAKMKKEMILAMKNDLLTTFREWYEKKEVYLVAASSAAKETTEEWIKEIKTAFPDLEVMCDDLSLGVSCHIGPGGLGIGCSCKPRY